MPKILPVQVHPSCNLANGPALGTGWHRHVNSLKQCKHWSWQSHLGTDVTDQVLDVTQDRLNQPNRLQVRPYSVMHKRVHFSQAIVRKSGYRTTHNVGNAENKTEYWVMPKRLDSVGLRR